MRRWRRIVLGGLVGAFCLGGSGEASVFMSEILADPPSGPAGDANHDGVGNAQEDEFVELYNDGGDRDLSGWSLSDAVRVRHVFARGTILPSGGLFVVFGGGTPDLPGIDWAVASSGGLGLNNSGDVLRLHDALGGLIDEVSYGREGGHDRSLARLPEGSRGAFVLHTDLPGAGGLRFSPGRFVTPPIPTDRVEEGEAVVPEPATWTLFALGVLGWRRRLRGHRP